jgi:hypothetical protein
MGQLLSADKGTLEEMRPEQKGRRTGSVRGWSGGMFVSVVPNILQAIYYSSRTALVPQGNGRVWIKVGKNAEKGSLNKENQSFPVHRGPLYPVKAE